MVLRIALINEVEVVVRGVTSMLLDQADVLQLVSLTSPMAETIDIALYDTFAMHRHDGPSVAHLLNDHRIDRVVVYTWNFQPWLAKEAIKQGVSGYLSKSLTATQLGDALLAVHAGHITVSPTLEPVGVACMNWPGRSEGLTAREAEALSLIARGLSNKEISERMDISINSVKSYIRSCYRKIDVDSRSKAVLWGLAHGLRPQPFLDVPSLQAPQTRRQVADLDREARAVDPRSILGVDVSADQFLGNR